MRKALHIIPVLLALLTVTSCCKHAKTHTRRVSRVTTSERLELPEISDDDISTTGDCVFLYRNGTLNGSLVRNWSFLWDYGNRISRWVAYPLYKSIYSGASRTDDWGYDPLFPPARQQNVSGGYREGNNGWYDRGQLLPSPNRAGYDLNASTFYGTNIVPMNQDFESGIYSNLDSKIRTWAGKSDTCYVVSGCICDEAEYYVYDRSDNKVTVPTAFFRAVLSYSKNTTVGTDGFCAAAFLFDHVEYSKTDKFQLQVSKSMSMSIRDLENVLGYKLFVNLSSVIGEDKAGAVKRENPQDNDWWWK